jgi:hypothetical protein
MQPSPDLTIRTTDTAPVAAFTLEDGDGNAVDLSGASVSFVLVNYATGAQVINATATIANATKGQVSYAWASGDTMTPGRYIAYWVVTFSGGAQESFPSSDTGLWVQITGAADAFRCLVGPSAWDAARYVRGLMRDVDPPPYQVVPDATYESVCEGIGEEFSRLSPLGDFVLGSPGDDPYSSPLQTVAYQQRYSLNPTYMSGLGLPPVMSVVDVLYRIGEQILAGADLAFFLLIPSSPLGRFVLDPTAQSTRVLRNNFLAELDHYGVGDWREERDINGFPCVDLDPVPQEGGIPLLVRYTAWHAPVSLDDGAGGTSYPSVPEYQKRLFGDLLYALVLESEATSASRSTSVKSGIVQRASSPLALLQLAQQVRSRTELALGMAVPIIARGSE